MSVIVALPMLSLFKVKEALFPSCLPTASYSFTIVHVIILKRVQILLAKSTFT